MRERGRAAGPVQRIAIIGPDWRSLVRLRGDLISELRARGHQVLCLSPSDRLSGSDEYARRLDSLGVECASFPLESGRLQLLADRKSIARLAEKLADWRAHAALAFQPKPMLLGALAAQRAGVGRIVPLVANLGPELGALDGPDWRWRRLARAAFAASDVIVFHNHADPGRLRALGLLPRHAGVRVVPGAGVDLDHHAAQPLPRTDRELTFLMLAAREREKGVTAFCAAARQIRAWWPAGRFILAGPDGTGAGAISKGELNDCSGGAVELRGDHDDVRPLFAEAHVVVLPSVREGMSRVLIEALANARPIITTDVPGCQETVDDGVNGILVRPQDADQLAVAMRHLMGHRHLLPPMARASRLKAERLFDVRYVNAALMAAMGLA